MALSVRRASVKFIRGKDFPGDTPPKHTLNALLLRLWTTLRNVFEKREPREKKLILLGVGVALCMGLYTAGEFINGIFESQQERYAAVEATLDRVSPLIYRYHVLQKKKENVEQRFQSSGTSAANYAHLEAIIKRKAQVESRFEINKHTESNIENKYIVVPFTIRFQQISQKELSEFLKELSTDQERPSIVSRLSARTRGNRLAVEMKVDFISRNEQA
ncbi:MAG: hypothetical protein KDD60_00725 [Bdellovibrionales bacterium]|nr:hypothetical protein [Bdellovibrionales bacterium]